MEREQLVGAGFGDERQPCMRWRCRAASCMRAAISRRRAAARPITSRNGTGAVGRPLGSGMNGEVHALAVSGKHVVCGRRFHDGGRQRGQLHRAMEREQLVGAVGMRWMNYGVDALAVSGSTLYAGGAVHDGGRQRGQLHIAQWNGSSWSAWFGDGAELGCVCAGGVGQHVVCGRLFHDGGRQRGQLHRAMEREQLVGAGFGDERHSHCVCAGGVGQHVVCGRAISRRRAATRPITSRNGTGAVGRRWVRGLAAARCMSYALAVSGSTLYAGGNFTTAGGNAANYIAQWNGSSWSALGSGMNGAVYALAVSGSTLYAGGNFTTAGSNAANYIAQWNGSSWSALGSGIGGAHCFVSALAVSGGTLYAGGYFTTAGGNAATNIAQWNGSSWSALGSGIGGDGFYPTLPWMRWRCRAAQLYAGGYFTTAGTNGSAAAAQAICGRYPSLPSSHQRGVWFHGRGVWFRRGRPGRRERGHSGQHGPGKRGFRCKPICSAAVRSISPIRNLARTASASTKPICCRRIC